ncbi:MAG: hypothetical protein P0S94_00220 [Simkaniaceae bacterium]|nr:hypothetical protein [Simkaniaceae bacterium]
MSTIYENQDIAGKLLYVSKGEVYIEDKTAHYGCTRKLFQMLGMRAYSKVSVLKQKEVTPLLVELANNISEEANIFEILDGNNSNVNAFLDHKLNAALQKFMKEAGAYLTNERKERLDTLCEYTFKAKKIEEIKAINTKLEGVNFDNIDEGFEKLSLKQMRLIESMETAKDVVDKLKGWGGNVDALETEVNRAIAISDRIRTEADKEISEQPFSMMNYDYNTMIDLYGERFRKDKRRDNIMFQANNAHSSVVYRNANGQMQEAHMWGKPSIFNNGRMPLTSYAFQRTTLDFSQCLTSEQAGALYVRHGNQYVKELEKKFATILEKHYTDGRYKNLHNPVNRRIFSYFKSRNNPFKSWRKQIDFEKNGEVFCSEFIAKSILKAFVELQNDLKKEHPGTFDNFEPPINTWRRIANVFPSTLSKKAKDSRYTLHAQAGVIQKLFDVKQNWLYACNLI